MSQFQAIFEEYGADFPAAMSRFLNNEELYLKLLGKLFKDNSFKKLGDALKENNLKDAFEAVHTLRGVVGNFSLTPLYHALEKLVEPLRDGEQRDDYLTMYSDVNSELLRAEGFYNKLKESVSD